MTLAALSEQTTHLHDHTSNGQGFGGEQSNVECNTTSGCRVAKNEILKM